MTPLDALIDGASGDEIRASTLLRQVKVLASRMGVQDLEAWVDHELRGYPDDAELPDYRGPFGAQVLGSFNGPFGSSISNAPIPSSVFPKELRDGHLFRLSFREPLAQIEELARSSSEKPLHAPWPANMIAYTNLLVHRGEITGLYDGMGLVQADRIVGVQQFTGMVDAVRTRVLELALALERVAPDAGERDAPRPDQQTIQNIVTNVYGGANIAVASTNVEQSITLPAQGDLSGLLGFLRANGFDDQDIEALQQAIEEDGDPRQGIGERTQAWLGRMAVGASKAAASGLGALAAKAIASFFGLPIP